jgi:hypothetical protein
MKKYLVTFQESGKPRVRFIVLGKSSLESLESLPKSIVGDAYISVRPATAEDISQYGDVK